MPYRRVDVRAWDDGRFRRLSRPAPNAQTLFFYFLTGPHTTAVPGVFKLKAQVAAIELEWDVDATRECYEQLAQTGDSEPQSLTGMQTREVLLDWLDVAPMAMHDSDTGLVYVPKAMRYNPPASSKNVLGWVKILKTLPECSLLRLSALTLWAQLHDSSPGMREAREFLHVMGASDGGIAAGIPTMNVLENKNKRREAASRPTAARGPSRKCKDKLIAMWHDKYDRQPAWATQKGGWIQLARIAVSLSEAQIEDAFAVYLADDRDFVKGHRLTLFCSLVDKYVQVEAATRQPTRADLRRRILLYEKMGRTTIATRLRKRHNL